MVIMGDTNESDPSTKLEMDDENTNNNNNDNNNESTEINNNNAGDEENNDTTKNDDEDNKNETAVNGNKPEQPPKLFVGRLPSGTKENQLKELFQTYGEVTHCDIVGKYGFVHMKDKNEADTAMKKLNNYSFNGSTITVQLSTSTAKKTKRKQNRRKSFNNKNNKNNQNKSNNNNNKSQNNNNQKNNTNNNRKNNNRFQNNNRMRNNRNSGGGSRFNRPMMNNRSMPPPPMHSPMGPMGHHPNQGYPQYQQPPPMMNSYYQPPPPPQMPVNQMPPGNMPSRDMYYNRPSDSYGGGYRPSNGPPAPVPPPGPQHGMYQSNQPPAQNYQYNRGGGGGGGMNKGMGGMGPSTQAPQQMYSPQMVPPPVQGAGAPGPQPMAGGAYGSYGGGAMNNNKYSYY